jgi:two-component system chemotaxis response regulator CheY
LKILVAEDEPGLQQIYKVLFENQGYQVVTTKDGQECVEAYQAELNKTTENKTPFDIVVLDYRMPIKNGVEAAKEILVLCPDQKLLMVTAYSGVLDSKDEKLRKMQIMSKPFDFDKFLATITDELKNV